MSVAKTQITSVELTRVRQRSWLVDAWRSLLRNRLAVLGLCIALVLFALALFGPALAPHDYLRQDLLHLEEGPSWEHWFGTDQLGRDLFSRVLWGARTAVLVAVIVTTIASTVGVILGATAAYLGGVVDLVIMRLTDTIMSFPHLLLAAFINATAKPPVQRTVDLLYTQSGWGIFANPIIVDYLVVFGALAFVSWFGYARLVRGQILSLREEEYIVAAEAIGLPRWRILLRHLIPNALSPIIVLMTVQFGGAMLSESSLSYMGIGIQPPGASWGSMIAESLDMWRYRPHLILMPGIVLTIVILGFNFLGDGLNDALDPRRRR